MYLLDIYIILYYKYVYYKYVYGKYMCVYISIHIYIYIFIVINVYGHELHCPTGGFFHESNCLMPSSEYVKVGSYTTTYHQHSQKLSNY